MLDPLNALSVAAAVVQFVQFGSDLIGTGVALSRSAEGALERNIETEELVNHLKILTAKLSNGPTSGSQVPVLASGDEKALFNIGYRCHKLAVRLLQVLDDLKVKGVRMRSWEIARQTVRSAMKAEQIRSMQEKLESMKIDLSLHLLSTIRDGQSMTCQRLQALEDTNRTLKIEFEDSMMALRAHVFRAAKQQQSQLHQLLKSTSQPQETQHIAQASYEKACTSLLDRITQLTSTASEIATSHKILSSLRFDCMKERQTTMRKAYPKTFSWAFEDETVNFKEWLRSSNEPFWISGKAGSGKSTLVKFIEDHPETKSNLEAWAGNRKLAMASFFFWNSGLVMQRSQEGLLQSLLYEIFCQCPELIPISTPTRWKATESFHRSPDPWTREELSKALRSVVASAGTVNARFCFLIDGLDEYEGLHYKLIQDLDQLVRSGVVKLCVSSRPWNVFERAYGSKRLIKLEELTRDDMDQYVKGMLEQDERFAELAARNERALDLVVEIRDRSQGVFFWVYLVVNSLLRGLDENDNVPILLKRLRALPRDLEAYFQHMLESVDEIYTEYSAKTLLLVTASPYALPAAAFCYLEDDVQDSQSCLRTSDEQGALHEISDLGSISRTLINKWCRDMIEVADRGADGEEVTDVKEIGQPYFKDHLAMPKVHFLHRTVREFLTTPAMQKYLKQQADSAFDCPSTMCRLFLSALKFPRSDILTDYHADMVSNFLYWTRQSELRSHKTHVSLLHELDSVCKKHWPAQNSYHWNNWYLSWMHLYPNYGLLSVAAFANLSQSVERLCASDTKLSLATCHQVSLFVNALEDKERGIPQLEEDDSAYDMTLLLLKSGMDVQLAWEALFRVCSERGKPLPRILDIVQLFLDAGADIHWKPKGQSSNNQQLSAYDCLKCACPVDSQPSLRELYQQATQPNASASGKLTRSETEETGPPAGLSALQSPQSLARTPPSNPKRRSLRGPQKNAPRKTQRYAPGKPQSDPTPALAEFNFEFESLQRPFDLKLTGSCFNVASSPPIEPRGREPAKHARYASHGNAATGNTGPTVPAMEWSAFTSAKTPELDGRKIHVFVRPKQPLSARLRRKALALLGR